MKKKRRTPTPSKKLEASAFLDQVNGGRTESEYRKGRVVFSQGEPADAVFYLRKGKVKIAVTSEDGKEAVVAILGNGDFFGEGCLTGQPLRIATAIALTDCDVVQVTKPAMIRALHERRDMSDLFITHLLSRNVRVEEDLVDQLFNSSEKRLARMLLLLANYGKEGLPEPILPRIDQETLAKVIGTTRSRVSFFMNKFRKLGLIEYNGDIRVHPSLLNVVLHD
jgi:CRP/FNR family cyclic AMP-dependent transcriptional regulator